MPWDEKKKSLTESINLIKGSAVWWRTLPLFNRWWVFLFCCSSFSKRVYVYVRSLWNNFLQIFVSKYVSITCVYVHTFVAGLCIIVCIHNFDAFEPSCWRGLLRVPWTAKRSNQSILKKISPEYSLEGLMLEWSPSPLATWWEEPTHWKKQWCWERLRAGGQRGNRGRDYPLDGIIQIKGHHWLNEHEFE